MADERFLGERRHVPPRRIEGISNRKPTRVEQPMAVGVGQQPFIRDRWPVKPDRVVEAERHVGMAHGPVYRLRNSPGAEEFNAAWEAALAKATGRIHDVLVDHAVNGAPEPIMYAGKQVGEFRRYNYRMMMWLLRHHQPEQFSGPQGGSGDSALSRHRMKRLKEQWQAEWEAEREAKGKAFMDEHLSQAAQQRKEHDERFHAKINDMRQKMIAHYIENDPATGKPNLRFNPQGASPMELLIYDEVSGSGDSNGKELREEMGFPPLEEAE